MLITYRSGINVIKQGRKQPVNGIIAAVNYKSENGQFQGLNFIS